MPQGGGQQLQPDRGRAQRQRAARRAAQVLLLHPVATVADQLARLAGRLLQQPRRRRQPELRLPCCCAVIAAGSAATRPDSASTETMALQQPPASCGGAAAAAAAAQSAPGLAFVPPAAGTVPLPAGAQRRLRTALRRAPQGHPCLQPAAFRQPRAGACTKATTSAAHALHEEQACVGGAPAAPATLPPTAAATSAARLQEAPAALRRHRAARAPHVYTSLLHLQGGFRNRSLYNNTRKLHMMTHTVRGPEGSSARSERPSCAVRRGSARSVPGHLLCQAHRGTVLA